MVSFSDRTISFCQSIDMHRMEVDVCHCFEKMGCRWRCGNGDANGLVKLFCILVCTEKGIYCRSCIEVCDIFCLEEFPYERIIDFTQAEMRAPDSCHCPWEC